MERKGRLFDVMCAAETAVLFLPAHFLQSVMCLAADETVLIIPLYLLPAICGALCFFACAADRVTTALLRIALSFPFTVLFWQIQIRGDLHRRALNWVIPGYGESSAGGNFAGFIELLLMTCALICGFIAAIVVSASKPSEKLARATETIQTRVLPAVYAAVTAAVMLINSMMPAYVPEIG